MWSPIKRCLQAASDYPTRFAGVRLSWQMRHTFSVEVAYRCAQQVRDVFHQDTRAQGRRLAARLIERLPTCPIPDIAHLGRTLRTWKDALGAYLDTAGASNAPHRSHQRNHRTRQTNRQRLPQHHQLPTPNAPHHRRLRCLHPHSTLKSRITFLLRFRICFGLRGCKHSDCYLCLRCQGWCAVCW